MKSKKSAYWNIGTSIVLFAAIGIVIGAIFNNPGLWLCIGAGVGVVVGVILQM